MAADTYNVVFTGGWQKVKETPGPVTVNNYDTSRSLFWAGTDGVPPSVLPPNRGIEFKAKTKPRTIVVETGETLWMSAQAGVPATLIGEDILIGNVIHG